MFIKRLIYKKLINEIKRDFISVLIGPRQVGKTSLLNEIKKECDKKGYKTVFFNLEDPTDLRKFVGKEADVINYLKNIGGVIFIDEFHYLKNATKIFKALYDLKTKIKIFASGSSSLEIHKHLKESLAGRYRSTIIHPLYYYSEMSQCKSYSLNDYMRTGGLPGILHERNLEGRMDLLKNILQAYLLKDIKSLIKEENIKSFNYLLYLLAQNQGSVASVASFAREIGLSEPAINFHLGIMANTYVCFPVESYSSNLANELKKSKKYYLFDIGIRNSILKDFSPIRTRQDKGIIIETFVFLNLLKQLKPNEEIKFWRTKQGYEVDFILLKNRIPLPIEVKYKVDNLSVPKGLKSFLDKYKQVKHALVLSTNMKGKVKYDKRNIYFRTLESSERIEDIKK